MASVLLVSLMGVVLLIGLAAGFATATASAHRRAQAAADLAALAGAQAVQRGRDPCRTAAGIAAANGARLVQCRRIGREVVAEVVLPGPALVGYSWDLRGRARAGPARSGPGTSSPE